MQELLQQVKSLQVEEVCEPKVEKKSESVMISKSMASMSSIEPREKGVTRTMSSNSLLRSRTTVAQDFPAGPLRKVVVEVLADDTEVVEVDTWMAWLRNKAAQLVRSRWFEFAAGFIIAMPLGASLLFERGHIPGTCTKSIISIQTLFNSRRQLRLYVPM